MTCGNKTERGVALLIVLLATALLTVVIMEFTYSSQVEYRRTATWVTAKKAALLAESGVLVAARALEYDSLLDRLEPPASDSLDEFWAKPWEVPVGDGAVFIRIEDESALFNLNQLMQVRLTDSVVLMRARELFERSRVDPATLGPIIDWLDRDSSTFVLPTGAEQEYYRGLDPGYSPRNSGLRTFSELALVRNVGPRDLYRLRRVAGIRDLGDTRININTAPIEVLLSLHVAMDELAVAAIVDRRSEEPFTAPAQFTEIEALQGIPLASLVKFTSDVFRVRATGAIDGVYQSVEALIRRTSGRSSIVYSTARRGPNVPLGERQTAAGLDDLEGLTEKQQLEF